MTTNDKPVCDRDVDLMRDVYMTREQRAAYNRILDAAMRPQPAAPQVPEDAAERLAKFIYEQEARNCKTLDDALHHSSKWRRALPEARKMLEAALATPPAPEQPKPAETREQRRASALTFSDTNPEAGFIADGERLNCPACGGSGHVGDVQPKPAGDVEALAEWLEREMPAGTVIGDPRWWAEKIARRLAAQPAQGEGEK